jgi:hypothetical protein
MEMLNKCDLSDGVSSKLYSLHETRMWGGRDKIIIKPAGEKKRIYLRTLS